MQKKAAKKRPVKKAPVKKPQLNRVSGYPLPQELQENPLFVILHGKPGAGKSSTLAYSHNPIYLLPRSRERGIKRFLQFQGKDLDVKIEDEFETFPQLLDFMDELPDREEYQDRKTVVIESLTTVEELYFDHCLQEDYNGSKFEFENYSKGKKVAANSYAPQFLDSVRNLLSRGLTVFLTAHSSVKQRQNPGGEDFLWWVARCDTESWEKFCGDADFVFFIDQVTETEKIKQSMQKKVKDQDIRLLCGGSGNYSPLYSTKAWFPIEDPINLGSSPKEGYRAIVSAFEDAVS